MMVDPSHRCCVLVGLAVVVMAVKAAVAAPETRKLRVVEREMDSGAVHIFSGRSELELSSGEGAGHLRRPGPRGRGGMAGGAPRVSVSLMPDAAG